ncbi:MAG TPA: flagellar type III secretion system pore protein FliP [Patescibacteria group bacterium]|nr:flagellar type III secretion system pore protein FliP [Patescibacteria group bacterium]
MVEALNMDRKRESRAVWKRALSFLLPGIAFLIVAAILFIPSHTFAQSLTLNLGQGGEDAGGGSVASRVVQMVALLTILSLAPSILMMMTSFTRIVVVLSFLRTALGTQQTPPNTVMISLAMFLTLFIMMPTVTASYEQGLRPLMNDEVTEIEGFQKAVVPFKQFMLAHTREKDLDLFIQLAKVPEPKAAIDTPLQVVIPSFMISELRRAFEIGFLIFLPFLVIDMVTASILMSMGMMMLPPVMIALPFKIIFFVLVDGWALIAGSLVKSYGGA